MNEEHRRGYRLPSIPKMLPAWWWDVLPPIGILLVGFSLVKSLWWIAGLGVLATLFGSWVVMSGLAHGPSLRGLAWLAVDAALYCAAFGLAYVIWDVPVLPWLVFLCPVLAASSVASYVTGERPLSLREVREARHD